MTTQPEGDDHAPAWNLVMPFVACVSNGGPYDDDAFVAGFIAGQFDACLENGEIDDWFRYVHPELLPQLDLIAMRHGYVTTHEPCVDSDTWAYVTVKKVDGNE